MQQDTISRNTVYLKHQYFLIYLIGLYNLCIRFRPCWHLFSGHGLSNAKHRTMKIFIGTSYVDMVIFFFFCFLPPFAHSLFKTRLTEVFSSIRATWWSQRSNWTLTRWTNTMSLSSSYSSHIFFLFIRIWKSSPTHAGPKFWNRSYLSDTVRMNSISGGSQ